MRTLALVAVLIAAIPAFGQNHGVFRAHLVGFNEVPSVNSQAEGHFAAVAAGDNLSFDYALQFDGLQANVTQAHIHFSKSRINGPIIIWLCQTTAAPGPAGTQTCPQSGTIRGTVTAANVLASPPTQQLSAGDLADMLRAMRVGAAYVNVHTSASPGGEIRGQVFLFRH